MKKFSFCKSFPQSSLPLSPTILFAVPLNEFCKLCVFAFSAPLQNEAVMKAFDMFDSCMDEKTIEELDATPLLDLIKEYGSWNVTDGNWTEESWDFMDTFVKIQKYLSVAPLFNMYVSADLKDSTKNIIVVRVYPSRSQTMF